jgi:NADH-quinone oxidoreductase subunit I
MKITASHLFQPAVTLQYPDERWEMPERARNQLFNNIDDCIGCDKCARACPVDCIYIKTEKAAPDENLGVTSNGTKKRLKLLQFDIDMALCCYCSLCTYPCPTECLTMTSKYESSVYNRDDLLYHFADPERMYGHLKKIEKAREPVAVAEAAKPEL